MTTFNLYYTDLNIENRLNKCSSMLGVDSILWEVIADYCQVRNFGLQKIKHIKLGGDLNEWEQIKAERLNFYQSHKKELLKELIQLVPERFKQTNMFLNIYNYCHN